MKAPFSPRLRRYLATLAAEERSLERMLFQMEEPGRRHARAEWMAAFRQLRQRIIHSERKYGGSHPGFDVPVALCLFREAIFPDDVPVVCPRSRTDHPARSKRPLQRCA